MKIALITLSILFGLVALGMVRNLIDTVQGAKILITLCILALTLWAIYALATKKGPQIDKY